MTAAERPTLEVRQTPGPVLWAFVAASTTVLLGGIWLVAVGVGDLVRGGVRPALVVAVLVEVAMTAMAGVGIVMILGRGLRRDVRVRIGPEGVWVHAMGARGLGWDRVRRVIVWTQDVGYLGIRVRQEMFTVAPRNVERVGRRGLGLVAAGPRRGEVPAEFARTTEVLGLDFRPRPGEVLGFLEREYPEVEILDLRFPGRLTTSASRRRARRRRAYGGEHGG